MSSHRILIADDHAVIRTGMKYLLARHFHNVEKGEADACSQLSVAAAGLFVFHLSPISRLPLRG